MPVTFARNAAVPPRRLRLRVAVDLRILGVLGVLCESLLPSYSSDRISRKARQARKGFLMNDIFGSLLALLVFFAVVF